MEIKIMQFTIDQLKRMAHGINEMIDASGYSRDHIGEICIRPTETRITLIDKEDPAMMIKDTIVIPWQGLDDEILPWITLKEDSRAYPR